VQARLHRQLAGAFRTARIAVPAATGIRNKLVPPPGIIIRQVAGAVQKIISRLLDRTRRHRLSTKAWYIYIYSTFNSFNQLQCRIRMPDGHQFCARHPRRGSPGPTFFGNRNFQRFDRFNWCSTHWTMDKVDRPNDAW
jgi:hypothetical protein